MRAGACPCRAVSYSAAGPVRDVLVCHCNACVQATGGPWAASAVARPDIVVSGEAALDWERAPVSQHAASRGRCRTCETVVFWDAPGLTTVSFAAATLSDASGLEVFGHIWVDEDTTFTGAGDVGSFYPGGLPASVVVPWRGRTARV